VNHSEILDIENKNAEIAGFPQATDAMRHHYAINPFLVSSHIDNLSRFSHTGLSSISMTTSVTDGSQLYSSPNFPIKRFTVSLARVYQLKLSTNLQNSNMDSAMLKYH